MEKNDKKQPNGVVVIITDGAGREIANAADFDTSGYGGFTLTEAQSMRAERLALTAMVSATMGGEMSSAVISCGPHHLVELFRRLRDHSGWRMHKVVIGERANV